LDELTIGDIAEQAQVHIETLRYYERRGLVAQCLGNGPLTDCSILVSLETKGEDTP
jgi:MerR family regulatory protein